MFAVHMNNHPDIWSTNCGGGRVSKSITERSYKDFPIFDSKIQLKKGTPKFYLLDEMKIGQESDKKIALIRSFDSINKSIKDLKEKTGWAAPYITNQQYNELLEFAKREDVLGIQLETFILYPKEILKQTCEWLGLEYPEHMHDNRKSIIHCNCGSKFIVDDSKFVCKKHGQKLMGHGGYNPYSKIDKSKVENPDDWTRVIMNSDFKNKL